MKKIAFMFVAAAMFAACGGEQKPAQEAEVEAPVEDSVEEIVLTAEDSAAVLAQFEEGAEVADSVLEAAFADCLAKKVAAAAEAVEEVATEATEAVEDAVEE